MHLSWVPITHVFVKKEENIKLFIIEEDTLSGAMSEIFLPGFSVFYLNNT